jgi:hypothetical protein
MRSKGKSGAYQALGFVVWKTVMRSVRRDARDTRAKIRERRFHIAGALVAATAAIAAAAALAHRANGSQADV